MQYDYPEIRDILMVLVAGVYDGNDRLNGNPKLRGWGELTARSEEASEILQKFLDKNGVKFQVENGGIVGPVIKFEYGQNEKIDKTVQMMYSDPAKKRLEQMIFEARNHVTPKKSRQTDDAKEEALEQLQQMITDFKDWVRPSDDIHLYTYFYFDMGDIEKAQKLFETLGIPVEQHLSHANNRECLVLRCLSKWSEKYEDIIGKLWDAAVERKEKQYRQKTENFERGQTALSKADALKRLTDMITDVSRLPDAEEAKAPDMLSYCFYFDDANLNEAQNLFHQLGMPTKLVKKTEGETYLLYSRKKEDDLPDDVIQIIHDLATAVKEKIKLEQVTPKPISEYALDRIKEIINGYLVAKSGGVPYIYFTFSDMKMGKELLRVLGIETEEHYSQALSGSVLRMVQPTVKNPIWNVLTTLKNMVVEKKARKSRESGSVDRGEGEQLAVSRADAWARLKMLIQRVDGMSKADQSNPENGGERLYGFYFDDAVLDEAQKLLQIFEISTVREKDKRGITFLRYSVNADEMPDEVRIAINELYHASFNWQFRQNDGGSRGM